ncbi:MULTISPECIES: YggT family protein [unclassified Sphingomonas]|uniref:YggT family protein n=1 Tax=unclassified Sphingomonas TaxID=196159 RepID=UPI0006FFED23|nr:MULTISPECIES: YggT family protein [unclassified Sphingomonas]KQM97657.1 osmotic-shock protein [Sphingomonas sp. Leaf25]KQN37330.1 osmotic-shock protein [Sphingomonas sp. Leaf42]KQT27699.1 osmotic-shock protein [Sphingomonas sp. Leaf407]
MNVLLEIVQVLLNILWWIIIVQAILSILLSFNVINTQNDVVRQLYSGLVTLTEPIYRPIRRILPDFGAMDFAPFVVLILIQIVDRIIIPAIARNTVGMFI